MNPIDLLAQFKDFREKFMSDKPGMSPQSQIQQLLNSGKASQEQLEQARSLAAMVGVKL